MSIRIPLCDATARVIASGIFYRKDFRVPLLYNLVDLTVSYIVFHSLFDRIAKSFVGKFENMNLHAKNKSLLIVGPLSRIAGIIAAFLTLRAMGYSVGARLMTEMLVFSFVGIVAGMMTAPDDARPVPL
jgi:hypothetical protein